MAFLGLRDSTCFVAMYLSSHRDNLPHQSFNLTTTKIHSKRQSRVKSRDCGVKKFSRTQLELKTLHVLTRT
jgi:hypothetical protein